MTLHSKIIGGAFALTLGLGAMIAPAMAANSDQTSSGYKCSIGETFNGGSITGEHENRSQNENNPCRNVGRY